MRILMSMLVAVLFLEGQAKQGRANVTGCVGCEAEIMEDSMNKFPNSKKH